MGLLAAFLRAHGRISRAPITRRRGEGLCCRSADGTHGTHNDYFHFNFTNKNANNQKA